MDENVDKEDDVVEGEVDNVVDANVEAQAAKATALSYKSCRSPTRPTLHSSQKSVL